MTGEGRNASGWDDAGSADAGWDTPVDVGVERLLGLLWLFRHRDRVRTDDEIEARGYPDLRAELSTGRKNFGNDRARLVSLGLSLERTSDDRHWVVVGEPDDVMVTLSDAERDALTEAQLLVADSSSEGALPAAGATRAYVPGEVPVLLAAISDKRPLRFHYADAARFVDPHRVAVTATNRWYLLAIDREATTANTARMYRIDRISAATIDRDHRAGSVPAGATWSSHPSTWPTDPAVDVTVRFAHEPIPEWLAMLGASMTVVGTDVAGPLDGTFTVTNHEAFVRRVLAVGARVIGPPPIVALAQSILAAHATAYEGS